MADVIIPLHVSVQNPGDLENAILKALARKLGEVFERSVPGIRAGTQEEVAKAIRISPEYTSLLTGELWHELGIPRPATALEDIVAAIQESIRVTNHGVRVRGKGFDARMTIEILRSNYRDILGLKESSFESVSLKRGTTFNVPWLEWLLTGGDQLLVADFQYYDAPDTSKWSRTGLGIMIPSHKGWRCPPEFSGVSSDNWLTRALNDMKPVLVEVVKRELQKAVR